VLPETRPRKAIVAHSRRGGCSLHLQRSSSPRG
jgi:hypothetical protein